MDSKTAINLDNLGHVTDLATAANVLGLGKTTAYRLAQADQFPVRLIRMGGRYAVPVAELRELVGVSA